MLELLDVSRLEQGGLLGERAEVDIARWSETWPRAIAIRGGGLRLDAAEPVIATMDSIRFEQVADEPDRERDSSTARTNSRFACACGTTATEARLSVQDRGIGIPLQDQPLVFERFHRARNVDHRRFAGMGLGLYIARGIVLEHGGRIWVHSTPARARLFSWPCRCSSPRQARAHRWQGVVSGG